jgi:hypothetical protein
MPKKHEKHVERHEEPVKRVAPAKEGPTVEELTDALRGMVVAAEAAGGRDRPEVAHANAVLAKLEPAA